MTDIQQKVISIIAKTLGVEEQSITLDSHIVNDLGADSLDTTDLVMALENEFNDTVTDEKAQELMVVRDIVEYIERAFF